MSGRIRLSGGVTARVRGSTLSVHGDEVLVIEHAPPSLIDRLPCLVEGVSRAELLGGEDAEDVAEMLALLERLGFVHGDPPERFRGSAVERQVEYWAARGLSADAAQERVEAARVGILGLGGVGGVVLHHLLAGGVRNLALVDGDVVTAHNLNRQLIFRPRHLGRPKVVAAAELVGELAQGGRLHTAQCFVETEAQIAAAFDGFDMDLLVMAADTPPGTIRLAALDWCLASGTVYCEAACGLGQGAWGPLLEPANIPAYRARQAAVDLPGPAPMRASFGPTNTTVSAMLAGDVLGHLAGLEVPCANAIVAMDFGCPAIRRHPLDGAEGAP